MATVRFVPNKRNLAELTNENDLVGSAVVRAAEETVRRARTRVDDYDRIRTGYMRDSIRSEFTNDPNTATAAVGSGASYAIYQHQGTRYIEPAPFLTDALDDLSVHDYL